MNRTALGLLSVLVVALVVVGALTTRALMRGGARLVEAARSVAEGDLPGEPEASLPDEELSREPVDEDEDAEAEAAPDEGEGAEEPEGADEPDADLAPLERLAVAGGELAVYHDRPVKDAAGTLRKAARGTGIAVYEGDAPDEASAPYVKVRHVPEDDYEVLGEDTIDSGRDLTPADKAALKRSTSVTVLNFVLPPRTDALLQSTRLVAAYARLTGTVVWDEDAGEYLSQRAFRTRRLQSWEGTRPNVAFHFTVFTSTAEDGVTLTTGGLRHLALPELTLREVPEELEDEAVAAVNALVQTMVEQEWDGATQVTVELDGLQHGGVRRSMLGVASASASRRVQVRLAPSGEDGPVRLSFARGDVRAGLRELFGTSAR